MVSLSPTKTLIPMGVFVSILALPTFYIGSLMTERLEKLEDATLKFSGTMMRVEFRLESLKPNDRWTGSDMRVFAERLARTNPNVVIPDYKDLLGDDR